MQKFEKGERLQFHMDIKEFKQFYTPLTMHEITLIQ